MRKYLLLFLLLSSLSFAQKVNEYKYVIIPARFAFAKENNQYHLNSLLKLFFQNQGYETYLDNEPAPDDFIKNNCNKLFVDMKDSSTIFNTKISVVVKDCRGGILFTSDQGESRDKNEELAYNQALRMVLPSLKLIRHSTNKPLLMDESITPATEVNKVDDKGDVNLLKCKKTVNGVEIFNGKSKLVYTLLKTSVKDTYIAKKDIYQGIVYQSEGHWIFEYYQGGMLMTELIDVTIP